MQLYLMRHGQAMDGFADPVRPLTDRGRAGVEEVARRALAQGVQLDQISHSGLLRAQQTAELLGEILGVAGQIDRRPGLNPDDDPDPVARWCLEQAAADSPIAVAMVGHLPFLERLAARLLSGVQPAPSLRFRPAALASFVLAPGNRQFQLAWLLTPSTE
jgi:phosphohistidine phosphatase